MSKRILVVDDDPVVLAVLARHLNARGFEVSTASDGDEALELLDSTRVTLIVLDAIMPRVDGLLALRELSQRHPMLPVLVISGVVDQTKAALFIQEGAKAFVPKPVNFATLDSLVAAHSGGGAVAIRRFPSAGAGH